MPGEGNLRGFVGRGERGAEALVSSTTEFSLFKNPTMKIEEINTKKAAILYSEIDINPLFKGHAKEEDRSVMNATFSLINDDFKETFDSMLKDAGIIGINGHRIIGGYRASMYNAMPVESVKTLVEVMSELENKL